MINWKLSKSTNEHLQEEVNELKNKVLDLSEQNANFQKETEYLKNKVSTIQAMYTNSLKSNDHMKFKLEEKDIFLDGKSVRFHKINKESRPVLICKKSFGKNIFILIIKKKKPLLKFSLYFKIKTTLKNFKIINKNLVFDEQFNIFRIVIQVDASNIGSFVLNIFEEVFDGINEPLKNNILIKAFDVVNYKDQITTFNEDVVDGDKLKDFDFRLSFNRYSPSSYLKIIKKGEKKKILNDRIKKRIKELFDVEITEDLSLAELLEKLKELMEKKNEMVKK